MPDAPTLLLPSTRALLAAEKQAPRLTIDTVIWFDNGARRYFCHQGAGFDVLVARLQPGPLPATDLHPAYHVARLHRLGAPIGTEYALPPLTVVCVLTREPSRAESERILRAATDYVAGVVRELRRRQEGA